MEQSEFLKAMRDLTDFFGKTLSEKASKVWWEKIRFLDKSDMWAAVSDVTSNERQMPTPGIFLDYADHARARRTAKERLKEISPLSNITYPRNPELAKDCREHIEDLRRISSGPDREKCIRDFNRLMGEKYPHLKGDFDNCS
jgi:hypothetical protein